MNNFTVRGSVYFVAVSVLFSFLFTEASAQYFVKTKLDSTAFTLDSVVLTIDDPSGLFEWQKSTDTVTWKDIQHSDDSLWIRIDSSAFYRLKLTVENCDPVYSDMALVSFRSIVVDGNTFILEPEGGVYSLPSGARIVAPPGAVATPVPVKIELLDSLGAISKLPFTADFGKNFGVGMTCETDEEEFLKPVRVRLPVPNYKVVDIPVVFQYNKKSDLWSRYPGDLLCSQCKSFVEFTTTLPHSTRIHLIPDVFNTFAANPGGRTNDKNIDCKTLLADIKAEAYDFTGTYKGNDCYLSTETRSVNFPLCADQFNWKDLITEIGKDCKVNLTHQVKDCLKNGETTTMTIIASIAGMPLKDQHITVSFDPYLSSPGTTFPLVTNSEGKVSFPVKCSVDNFSGSLSYRLDYEYYLSVQEVSEGSVSEIIHRNKINGSLEGSATFRRCPYPYALMIDKDCGDMLYPSQHCQASAWCLDQYGNRIDCPGIEIVIMPSYTGTGAISIDENFMVTAQKGGVGTLKAIAPNFGLESQEISIAVGFEGTLAINDYKDYVNDWYDIMCGCPEDKVGDPDFRYYKVTYTGSMEISLWPSVDKSAPPTLTMVGWASTYYDIESPIGCHDDSFTENLTSLVADVIDPALGRQPTSEEVFKGNAFQIVIAYENFRSELAAIKFNASFNGAGFSLTQSGDFIPESCVGRIYNQSLVLY
jgi:hypothetical protein